MRTREEINNAFNDRPELAGHQSFVLVGIGGAGMSGVATMLLNRGFKVKGTDMTDSSVIDSLREAGASVHIGHTEDVVAKGDAVVLSDAIPLNISPEYRRAQELGCPVFRRSQCLGWLLEGKKCICVTGTHGKTTVTGMIAAGLLAAGLDPTIVVGAEVPQFGGSVIEGKGEWAVVEACEAYDSFHDFDPTIAVLTNLEMDHVDFHGDWESLKESVKRFVEKLPEDGVLFYCSDDQGAQEIANNFVGVSQGYDKSIFIKVGHPSARKKRRESMNESMEALSKISPKHREVFFKRDFSELDARCAIHGDHNWTNASGAMLAVFEVMKNSEIENVVEAAFSSQKAIRDFQGASRRLQLLHDGEMATIDDYAHHPTEVKASIQALREKFPDRRLIIVYQPHLYSRTADLIPEFAAALDVADHVFLTDIYPAREAPIPGVSSLRIAELMKTPVTYVPSRHLLPKKVKQFAKEGDVVVGMGAGNIESFAPDFVKLIQKTERKIAVVYGGDSAEREVSILSGRAVKKALDELGYDSKLIDVTELILNKADVSALKDIDLAFLCVHGTNAEDGAIQGFFELEHIPYTGSNILSSAIAMDKQLTKTILAAKGLPVPKGALIKRNEERPVLPDCPVVVKPNAQGSTVGLSFVEKKAELEKAIELAFNYDDAVLVEEMIKGIEISVPVAGDEVLPVVEIVPASGRYDFESKYTPGATEEICPARITDEQTKEAQRLALEAHNALGCEGVTRTDMFVTENKIVILEVNTLPGLTDTSLVPRSAEVHGWNFKDLVKWMVEDALKTEA